MYILIAIIFVIGYACIALEHPLRVNKAAPALILGVVIWTLLALNAESFVDMASSEYQYWATSHAAHGATASGFMNWQLMEHLGGIAAILFFLLGAMTIVELMDAHEAFRVVTDRITGTRKVPLMWILSIITFFLSAALDNMTTAIVMCALLRKMIKDKETLWLFAGMVIVAANAGGAWSPIGDVTTIMLWIGGQVTEGNIIMKLILPSLACLIMPLLWFTFTLKGSIEKPHLADDAHVVKVTRREQLLIFGLGLFALLGVPAFKTITHLPPYMGILLGLGVLWVVTEIMHKDGAHNGKGYLMVTSTLKRIDAASVLFFLGILTAVAGLETAGHLTDVAHLLDEHLGNMYAINTSIGVLSAVVDNIPLVAAAMGMYPLTEFHPDHPFWELLAYCAGTGGSILIIGSAAGVATMGILGIDFIWYVKRIAFPAMLGYFAGIAVFWLMWHHLH
ncbi:MAG: sodium:proton antiporter NhaD [Flavobacteriales bacterium]|nr:sodium:proton antiporter NhaD [Flavobacteriales bacterium]